MEALIGDTAEVIDLLDPTGTVKVQGETWNAESLSGVIGKGQKVRIKEMRNLKLYVEPVNS
jgi:membrane-bound serine protease (ClpP class)